MNQHLAVIRELQRTDDQIRALTEEIARLPKYVAEIERKLHAHERQLDADRELLSENQKSRRGLEREVETFEQKGSKLRDQMNEAKTNEQFRAFQHEIKFTEDEARRVEDRILDKMEEAETLQRNVQAAEQALKIETANVQKEVVAARERVARDEEQLVQRKERRKELTASLPSHLLRLYEKVYKARGGVAVAEALAERCTACNVMFRPQFSQLLRHGDEIMTCESCGVILYHAPPGEGLEDPAHDTRVVSG
jgi:predicted  nucleic acid-binding Zn-ribbon protein